MQHKLESRTGRARATRAHAGPGRDRPQEPSSGRWAHGAGRVAARGAPLTAPRAAAPAAEGPWAPAARRGGRREGLSEGSRGLQPGFRVAFHAAAAAPGHGRPRDVLSAEGVRSGLSGPASVPGTTAAKDPCRESPEPRYTHRAVPRVSEACGSLWALPGAPLRLCSHQEAPLTRSARPRPGPAHVAPLCGCRPGCPCPAHSQHGLSGLPCRPQGSVPRLLR